MPAPPAGPARLSCSVSRRAVEPNPHVPRLTPIRNPRCARRVGGCGAGTGVSNNDGLQSHIADLQSLLAAIAASPIVVPAPKVRATSPTGASASRRHRHRHSRLASLARAAIGGAFLSLPDIIDRSRRPSRRAVTYSCAPLTRLELDLSPGAGPTGMDTDELLSRFAVALGIGLLIGLERGWRARDEKPGSRAAGIPHLCHYRACSAASSGALAHGRWAAPRPRAAAR